MIKNKYCGVAKSGKALDSYSSDARVQIPPPLPITRT